MSRTVEVIAPAKVNLHLAVGDVRPDGYHVVRTVLHALELADIVRVSEASSNSFACSPDLGVAPEENLAFRAARAMEQRFARRSGLAIHIEKRIPAGAGLGGASADAAAVVVALAALWGMPRDSVALGDVARSLGADVPFFIEGGAVLFGSRGDVLERRLTPLDLPVAVVKPDAPVPTGQAYAAFDLLRAIRPHSVVSPDALIAALRAGDADAVGARLHNSMTDSSATIVPAITGVLEFLSGSAGVLGFLMAGSGSACYALCRTDTDARRCAAEAAGRGFWSAATRTRATGCEIREL